jgi:hypothetical protein
MVNAAALLTTLDKPILPPAVPSLSPVAAGGMFVIGGQAKVIRVFSGTQASTDGFVGFANTADLQASGSGYDLIRVAEHDLSYQPVPTDRA